MWFYAYLAIGLFFSLFTYVVYRRVEQRAILTPFIFLTLLLWPLIALYALWRCKRIKWRGRVIWERGQ